MFISRAQMELLSYFNLADTAGITMIQRRTLLTMIGASIPASLAGRSAAASMAKPSHTNAGHVAVLGGQLKYLSVGRGKPLILLHKLGGRIQEWRHISPALSEHYRVIAFDLAGHGESQMQGPPPFIVTQEAMAAQVMGALDSLRIPPPYRFVGSSLGGCVATVCAMLWPQQVHAVASVGSALAGSASFEELREAAAGAIASGQFDQDDNPLPRDIKYAREVFGVENVDIANEQNVSRAQAGQWISPVSRGVGRFDYLSRLPAVEAPMLLAWGERGGYGGFVPAALAKLPEAVGKVIPNSGAFPHEEAPDATAKAVLSFLK